MSNNQLPAEVQEHINSEAIKRYPLVASHTHTDGPRSGYIAGATAWAIWKVLYDELKGQSGPVWVNASEFKYEIGIAYHAKDRQSKGAGCFNEAGNFKWGDGSTTYLAGMDDLFILDESGAIHWEGLYEELKEELREKTNSLKSLRYALDSRDAECKALKEKADKMEAALRDIAAGKLLSQLIAAQALAWKGEEQSKLTPEQIAERKEAIDWYRNPAGHEYGQLKEKAKKLRLALVMAVFALKQSYDVKEWPGDGSTEQDSAIKIGEEALTSWKEEKEETTCQELNKECPNPDICQLHGRCIVARKEINNG